MDGRFSFPPDALKIFRTTGRGPRNRVDERERNAWHRRRITRVDRLIQLRPMLTPAELAGRKLVNTKIKLGITPYYFKLINPADEVYPCDSIAGSAHQQPRVRPGIESRVFEHIASAVAPARYEPSEGFVSPELV